MSDNLLDMRDIFAINSIESSPLNENIHSIEQMQQVIEGFNEESNISELRYNDYNDSSILKDYQNDSKISEQTQNILDCNSILIDSKISSQSEQQSNCNEICTYPLLQDISSCHFQHLNYEQVSQSQICLDNERSFSVRDELFGGKELSFIDLSKQIYSQYKQMHSSQNINNENAFNNGKQELQSIQKYQNNDSILDSLVDGSSNQNKILSKNEIDQKTKESEVYGNKKQECIEKGICKIKELGDTIKSSLTTMHLKFNEVKTCVSLISGEDKYKDEWDSRLNEFYNKLFNQASQALFVPNQAKATPSKIIIKKPQSVYRIPIKPSVSKPISVVQPMRKPGSVQRFNAPSMLSRPKSVLRGGFQEHAPILLDQNTSRQKSFTVQKFNIKQQPTPTQDHFGILKNSKNIKKESVQKIFSDVPSKSNSVTWQNAGKENNVFFKK